MHQYRIIFFQDLGKIMNEHAIVNMCLFQLLMLAKLPLSLLDSNSCHQTFAGYPFVVTYRLHVKRTVLTGTVRLVRLVR